MPKTLLLADDSVTIQKVVGISFANEDIVLLTVDNGEDAVRRASEARPDIVLADVVMPGLNGYEVCEAIKADPNLAATPVLLLTGTFEAFDEARAQRAGADGHITKPFEAQALVDQVNALLAQTGAAPVASSVAGATPSGQAVSPSADTAYDFFDDEVTEPGRSGEPAAETTLLSAPPPPAFGPRSDEAFGFEEPGGGLEVESESTPDWATPIDAQADRPPGEASAARLFDDAAPEAFAAEPSGSLADSYEPGGLDTAEDSFAAEPRDLQAETRVMDDYADSAAGPTADHPFAPADAEPERESDAQHPEPLDAFTVVTPLAPASGDAADPFAPQAAYEASDPFAPQAAYEASDPFAPQAAYEASDPFAPQAAYEASDPFAPQAAYEASDPFAPQAGDEASNPFAAQATDEASDPFAPQAAYEASDPFAPHAIDEAADPLAQAVPEAAFAPFAAQASDAQPGASDPLAGPPSFEPDDELAVREPSGAGFVPELEDPLAASGGEPPLQSDWDGAMEESGDGTVAFEYGGPLAEVEPNEIVGEAVLDPTAGRDYDVSSSDLGSPLAPPAPVPTPLAPLPPAVEPSGFEPGVAAADDDAEVSPLVRQEVRDAIEKIAWEAFGQLTETLVKEALERVERVAWEVVPQMTEALIREEIRKLKGGEAGDD